MAWSTGELPHRGASRVGAVLGAARVSLRPRRPVAAWVQPPLFEAGRRVYRHARIDLRTGPAPDNPWLAWALYLAHTVAEARGWGPVVRRGMQRVLVMLLAC